MNSVREEKNELRQIYRQRRRTLDPQVKAEMDKKICDLIAATVSYRFASTLLLYYPKKEEVNVLPLLRSALQAGKRVALPVSGEGGIMDFYFITDPEQDLVPGAFGIPAPGEHCEKYEKSQGEPAMILVPALSFDKDGYRLGYGRGYYDRYMNGLSACSVGVCYKEFLEERLPRGKFDRAVSMIVTEKGVRIVGK